MTQPARTPLAVLVTQALDTLTPTASRDLIIAAVTAALPSDDRLHVPSRIRPVLQALCDDPDSPVRRTGNRYTSAPRARAAGRPVKPEVHHRHAWGPLVVHREPQREGPTLYNVQRECKSCRRDDPTPRNRSAQTRDRATAYTALQVMQRGQAYRPENLRKKTG